jgi:hypothetical protein
MDMEDIHSIFQLDRSLIVPHGLTSSSQRLQSDIGYKDHAEHLSVYWRKVKKFLKTETKEAPTEESPTPEARAAATVLIHAVKSYTTDRQSIEYLIRAIAHFRHLMSSSKIFHSYRVALYQMYWLAIEVCSLFSHIQNV